MSTISKSDFLKQAKSLGKEAVAANKEKAAPFLKDTEICDILDLKENVKKNFESRLTKIRYGIDKKKNPYFSFDFILLSGRKGMMVSEFIGIPKDDKDTRHKRLKVLLIKMQQLGVTVEDATPANIMEKLVEASDRLTETKPQVTIALSRYVMANKSSSINLQIISMNDEVTEEEAREVAVEAGQPQDFLSLGTLADNGDKDAIDALTEVASTLEVDPNDYETWEAFATYATEELTVPSPEEATSEEEYTDTVEVSAEDIEYGESCVGYEGSFTDEEGDTITGTVDSYDPETNTCMFTGEDGTEYQLPMSEVSFE